MLKFHPMGATDCITAVMSNVQQYNMHNKHIEKQPHKDICRHIYKHTINKRGAKANTKGTVSDLLSVTHEHCGPLHDLLHKYCNVLPE